MIFAETSLKGSYVIFMEPHEDGRGFFARTFCGEEFAKQGLDAGIAQCNMSYNAKAGTIRGMHYQVAPHEETKVVICTQGSVFDAIVDLRSGSPTAGKWFGLSMRALDHRVLYVPRGFAHGYLALTDDATVFYMVSVPYNHEYERTLLWNDPAVGIKWPKMSEYVVSEKDKNADNLKKCLGI